MEHYLHGCGVDVSKVSCINQAEHLYIEPDNLYKLHRRTGVEVYDYLYSRDVINSTKYFRILLYEWFIVVKKGGYIIIDFQDNDILDLETLKEEISSLFLYRNRHKIAAVTEFGDRKRLIIQKLSSIKDETGMNQWSFGMVTNGRRKDFIKKSIESIRLLEIPQYEIIICGRYEGPTGRDIVFIPFTEKDEEGWITRKKNLICESARYENIVVFHDRINFQKNWFHGMKKWGNYFDVLSTPIYYPTVGVTKVNWDTFGFRASRMELEKVSTVLGSLDPSDWDKDAIIGGPVIIIKKSVWQEAKWDENLYWGDWEDIDLSYRQSEKGILLRFNPYATVTSEIVTVPLMNFRFEKDTRGLGRYSMSMPLRAGLYGLDLLGFSRRSRFIRVVASLYNRVQKTRNWKREELLLKKQGV